MTKWSGYTKTPDIVALDYTINLEGTTMSKVKGLETGNERCLPLNINMDTCFSNITRHASIW